VDSKKKGNKKRSKKKKEFSDKMSDLLGVINWTLQKEKVLYFR